MCKSNKGVVWICSHQNGFPCVCGEI